MPRRRRGPGGELALDLDRRADRVVGAREGDHEAVALRLDDVFAVPAGALADDPVVSAEHLQPGLVAELFVERGRVLDVGEEDRQGAVARRELAQLGFRVLGPSGQLLERAPKDLAETLRPGLVSRAQHRLQRRQGATPHPAPCAARSPAQLLLEASRAPPLPLPEEGDRDQGHDGGDQQDEGDPNTEVRSGVRVYGRRSTSLHPWSGAGNWRRSWARPLRWRSPPHRCIGSDPGRWLLTGASSVPASYWQGLTTDPRERNIFFTGFREGLWRTTPNLLQTAGIANAIPPEVLAAEGYNHIGDPTWNPRRRSGDPSARVLRLSAREHLRDGPFGVADPSTLAWRYYVKLDTVEIAKAMWAETSPNGRLIWTSSGADLLAYRSRQVSFANHGPGGPLLHPVRRLEGAVPPSGSPARSSAGGGCSSPAPTADPTRSGR